MKKKLRRPSGWKFFARKILFFIAIFFVVQKPFFTYAAPPAGIGQDAWNQIAALEHDKSQRTETKQKIDSHFIFNRFYRVQLLQ